MVVKLETLGMFCTLVSRQAMSVILEIFTILQNNTVNKIGLSGNRKIILQLKAHTISPLFTDCTEAENKILFSEKIANYLYKSCFGRNIH